MLDNLTMQMLLRLCLAALLGGVVGIERGSGDRPAGLRTHILVCAGSALIMLVSLYGSDGITASRDSSRIAAQVVSGIGFLGAGTILHDGFNVRGLTTAASLWMVAAIGLASGSGMYLIAIFATAIMLITLVTFHQFEKLFYSNTQTERRYIKVIVRKNEDGVTMVLDYLQRHNVKTRTLNINDDAKRKIITVDLYLKMLKNDGGNIDDVIDGIQDLNAVVSLEKAN
jgi:putative Mg2+ transporter-C (MgtC) family protein